MNNRLKLVIEALEDLEINSPETRFEMSRIIAIQELEKQLNGGWIPVSERLPEKSGKYLITIKNLTGFEMPKEYIFICDYFHAIKEFMFDSWEDNKIVAWQPLPEPHKEVEQ